MLFKINERGMTLVELLAALTILSVVVVSLFSFFIQAGLFSRLNSEKTVGVNLARKFIEEYTWCTDSTSNPNCSTTQDININNKMFRLQVTNNTNMYSEDSIELTPITVTVIDLSSGDVVSLVEGYITND